MADFVQTMKDWRRMCKAQDDGSNRDVCATCPFGILGEGCSSIYEDDMDYAKLESVVTAWAAEHPEPVYPTWEQYLVDLMTADMKADKTDNPNSVENYMRKTRIPADIAQKLGVQPKEDKPKKRTKDMVCGNDYCELE